MRKLFAAALALLALLPLPALAQQQNFILVNRTGYTIMSVNVSPTASNNWGPDILGTQVVQDGQQVTVQFPPGITECNFDVRITYDSGDSSDVRAVDLCRASQITVTYDEDEEETSFQVQ